MFFFKKKKINFTRAPADVTVNIDHKAEIALVYSLASIS